MSYFSATIGVCTRNNPVGLSALLGSLLAQAGSTNFGRIRLIISDSSDRPILSDPSLSRLLPSFRLTYLRDQPGLLTQRGSVLSACGDKPIWMLDDDHIVLSDFMGVFESVQSEQVVAASGTSADLHNDKGYADYSLRSADPSEHSLYDDGRGYDMFIKLSRLADHSANGGNIFLRSGSRFADAWLTTASLLPKAHGSSGLTQGAADDLIARVILSRNGSLLCTGFQCLHVGNSNNWWKADGSHKKALLSGCAGVIEDTVAAYTKL